MNIQRLLDMDDDEYAEAVSQASKGRRDFPHWWRAVLHPDLIDETEAVLTEMRDSAARQALTPERYPAAANFEKKVRGLLVEVALERSSREEG